MSEGKRERALETIERNARTQAQIIEDLLDVSRIVSGKLRIDVGAVNLIEAIESAVDTIRPAADARGIALEVTVDRQIPTLRGDPCRLLQVVSNLLTNAVKFTPSGGSVRVGLVRLDVDIELSVSDTGTGIEPAFLPHVFERFSQAESGEMKTHGGLGLGLAIVRHIVELHGGTVEAHSDGLGCGARFTVRLPAVSPNATPREIDAATQTVAVAEG